MSIKIKQLFDWLLNLLNLVKNDPAKAREMGAKGRDRAHERFNENRIVDQYEQLYESCLTDGPENG